MRQCPCMVNNDFQDEDGIWHGGDGTGAGSGAGSRLSSSGTRPQNKPKTVQCAGFYDRRKVFMHEVLAAKAARHHHDHASLRSAQEAPERRRRRRRGTRPTPPRESGHGCRGRQVNWGQPGASSTRDDHGTSVGVAADALGGGGGPKVYGPPLALFRGGLDVPEVPRSQDSAAPT